MLALGLAVLFLPAALGASDHADPLVLEVLESGITDLYAFPDGDQLIVMLNVRRALTTPPPYQLEPFEYAIYMDVHSEVTIDNLQQRVRYGGTIKEPSRIKDLGLRLGGLNIGAFFGAQPDTPAKLVGFAFAFEHLEVAAYEQLRRVAERADDQATADLAERLAGEEREAAAKLAGHFDEAVEAALAKQGVAV